MYVRRAVDTCVYQYMRLPAWRQMFLPPPSSTPRRRTSRRLLSTVEVTKGIGRRGDGT